jgi:hypothetical protein
MTVFQLVKMKKIQNLVGDTSWKQSLEDLEREGRITLNFTSEREDVY